LIRGPGGFPFLNKAEVNKILCVLLKAKKLEISLDIAVEVPEVTEATSTVCTTTKTGRNTTLTKQGTGVGTRCGLRHAKMADVGEFWGGANWVQTHNA
jgi:hypothetical protein